MATLSAANEIIPGVWIGDMNSASNASFFQKHKIGAVLNCTPDVPHHFISHNIEYMRINMDDNGLQSNNSVMKKFLPHGISFIYKNRDLDSRNVLVHCHAGIQRSATIVSGYLYRTKKQNMKEVMKYVLSKRPQAFFGGKVCNFQKSLNELT